MAVIADALISNMLYIIVGKRLIKFLAGVKIKEFRDTLKLSRMLLLCMCVMATWAVKRVAIWHNCSKLSHNLPLG